MTEFVDLAGLLHPNSVAVVGAAERTDDPGGDTVRNLVRFGYPGQLWVVNPDATSVHGVSCFASLVDLPQAPDLAILAVPAHALAETIRACVARGTRYGVAFAGGPAEGDASQHEVIAACRDTGFTLCGPHCFGFINVAASVAATYASALSEFDTLRAGPISMVTQSAGIGTTVFSAVQRAGFGVRHLIGSGSEAVVRVADYIFAMACDEGTRMIAVYLEGIDDGARLVRALEVARDRGKPVVLIRAGAASAPPGDDRVFDAILQELGVIRVRSVEELVDVCLLLASIAPDKLPIGRGVGIATLGHGTGMLAADQCAAHGLDVPTLATRTIHSLAQLPAAMDALAAQADINALLLIVGAPGQSAAIVAMVTELVRRCDKPVCVCWPAPPASSVQHLADAGIVAFDEPDRALRALGLLVAHSTARARPQRGSVTVATFDWNVHVEPSTKVVSEDRCHAILMDAGLPVAPGKLAIDAAAALPIAHQIGLPVALKCISPQVTQRAAAGLLAIDLRSADEVLAHYRRLEDRARAREIVLDGIYVQQMQRGGIELSASVFRDPIFGTMVSCASGGGMATLMDDGVMARAPVTEAVAADMVERLRCRASASDAQGRFDIAAPAAFIARLSLLGASAPWRGFTFQVNPVNWTRSGVVAVDALLVIVDPTLVAQQ